MHWLIDLTAVPAQKPNQSIKVNAYTCYFQTVSSRDCVAADCICAAVCRLLLVVWWTPLPVRTNVVADKDTQCKLMSELGACVTSVLALVCRMLSFVQDSIYTYLLLSAAPPYPPFSQTWLDIDCGRRRSRAGNAGANVARIALADTAQSYARTTFALIEYLECESCDEHFQHLSRFPEVTIFSNLSFCTRQQPEEASSC